MRNDFYSLSNWQQDQHSLSCRLSFETRHRIFEGHFPGHPIVPGVCSIAIVKEALESAVGQTLLLRESSIIKFLGLIHPDSQPTLRLSWTEHEGNFQVTASLQEGDNFLFKLIGKYEPVPTNGKLTPATSLEESKNS